MLAGGGEKCLETIFIWNITDDVEHQYDGVKFFIKVVAANIFLPEFARSKILGLRNFDHLGGLIEAGNSVVMF